MFSHKLRRPNIALIFVVSVTITARMLFLRMLLPLVAIFVLHLQFVHRGEVAG